MGRLRTISRRSFLVGSVAIGGGVAFGTYLANKPAENPLTEGLVEGQASFNPWVVISPEQITLIVPHADKGQGVASSQAALIAEELDVEFGQFEITFGEPAPAYYNTALAEESAPFMATDESFQAESARSVIGGMLKIVGLQATGGSTTMADSFHKLRVAGAVARETLKEAASRHTGVPVADLKTESGAVLLPDGSSLKYQELAGIASEIAPVRDVELRDPSEWRFVGKPMQRLDIVGKSTGTLQYGIDASVEGMVHATVVVNPRKGGKLNSFDASAAESMRGIKKIMPVTGGVAIVADNTWRAIKASEAITYDWGPASYPAEQADHWKNVEASFVEERLDSKWRDDGDVTTATGTEIQATYRSPYVAHQPLEPLNAIILVTDEGADVWTGHQTPGFVEQNVADVTGHDLDNVRFHNFFIGGSFGHRLEFDYIRQTAEIANAMRGTAVKMTYSREVDFEQDFTRHIGMARATGKVDGGKVVSIDLQVASPSVIGSQMSRAGLSVPGPDAQIAAGSWNNPYNFDNFRMRAYRVPENEVGPTSSWRSVGSAVAGFFFDSFLDELIHEAGADPMMERIRLMEHDVSRKVLEAVAEMSNWGADLASNQGMGVAFVESFGAPTAEVVKVTNTDAGIKIDNVWVASDVGTVVDPVNFENMVQGGVIFGLGHAMNSEITYADGKAQQRNYYDAEAMRIWQAPVIQVKGLENGTKIRGIGEPPVPPAAPALANAIFAATGMRLREAPFNKFIDFV